MILSMDFRHQMGCSDCWAFQFSPDTTSFSCKLGFADKNRPEEVPAEKLRFELSGVWDAELLMKWPCENRYTPKEIDLMKKGGLLWCECFKGRGNENETGN